MYFLPFYSPLIYSCSWFTISVYPPILILFLRDGKKTLISWFVILVNLLSFIIIMSFLVLLFILSFILLLIIVKLISWSNSVLFILMIIFYRCYFFETLWDKIHRKNTPVCEGKCEKKWNNSVNYKWQFLWIWQYHLFLIFRFSEVTLNNFFHTIGWNKIWFFLQSFWYYRRRLQQSYQSTSSHSYTVDNCPRSTLLKIERTVCTLMTTLHQFPGFENQWRIQLNGFLNSSTHVVIYHGPIRDNISQQW